METPHQALVAAVERAIDDADPIGLLEGGAGADEYGPEIGTIVPRVMKPQSVEEVTTVLHEEFLRWVGDDIAGPRHAYVAPAAIFGRFYSNSEERLTWSSGGGR
jgi:hypothetical protein